MKEQILKKIEAKELTCGVVGLGYVGLPLAVEKAKAGFKTIGFDVQINDSFNDTVGRQAQVYWSDYTGDSFLYLDRWGQIILK